MTRKLLLAMMVAALLLLTGCNKEPQPPLVFGAAAWPGYEPVYLAQELGYLQGVNLRLDAYAGPAEAEEAIRSGKAHLAGLTLDRALLLRRDVPDLKIVLVFDAEPARNGEPGRIDVMVTRDETIGQYHGEMQQLLQGWRRALDYMQANPDKAARAMAQRERLAPEQFNALLRGIELYGLQRNQQALVGEPPPIGATIEAEQRELLRQGKLSVGADPSMLIDSTLLAESPKK